MIVMKKSWLVLGVVFLYLQSYSQQVQISKEELIAFTPEWKGERFPDGRPKIPDNLLQRAKRIMIDDAWTVLKNEGYLNQYEGGWKTVSHRPNGI